MSDRAWFDGLYLSSRDRLLMIALAFTRDLDEAEDVVQEAFLRGWGSRQKLRQTDNPEAWLCTVALNVARRRGRRRAMLRMLTNRGAGAGPELQLDTMPLIDLHRAVDALPADQRAVVVLHHLADLPVAQIAESLGVAVGTVKSRLARARAQLRLDLDPAVDIIATAPESDTR